MSKYKCKYGLYHDRKCVNNEPRSNNGWIYSAYSKYLAPSTLDMRKVSETYKKCVRSYTPLQIDRLPGKKHPPLSKDEVIGQVSLGLLHHDELERSHYNFCNIDNKFDRKLTFKNFITAAKTLYKIKDEHRNYMWENEIVEAYPLAFTLGPEDVYYVKKMSGKRPSIFESVVFYLNAWATIRDGNKSARMMLWLKCKDMDHRLLGYCSKDKWVRDYFESEHDFVVNL